MAVGKMLDKDDKNFKKYDQVNERRLKRIDQACKKHLAKGRKKSKKMYHGSVEEDSYGGGHGRLQVL